MAQPPIKTKPDGVQRFGSLGMAPAGYGGADELGALLCTEAARWRKVVSEGRLRSDWEGALNTFKPSALGLQLLVAPDAYVKGNPTGQAHWQRRYRIT
jgi:hypothetical protein